MFHLGTTCTLYMYMYTGGVPIVKAIGFTAQILNRGDGGKFSPLNP